VPARASLLEHVEVTDEDGTSRQPEQLPVVSAVRDATSRDATLGYALPGGGRAWYSIRAAPITLDDGSTGTVVTCEDVTEQHEQRHRLTVAERSLRLTFDHAPIRVAVITPDGAVTQVNPALCELLGLPEHVLLDGGFRAALHPEERGWTRRRFAAILTGDPSEPLLRELRFVHASGRLLYTQAWPPSCGTTTGRRCTPSSRSST
jgi:PAS domain S-box-containing protein